VFTGSQQRQLKRRVHGLSQGSLFRGNSRSIRAARRRPRSAQRTGVRVRLRRRRYRRRRGSSRRVGNPVNDHDQRQHSQAQSRVSLVPVFRSQFQLSAIPQVGFQFQLQLDRTALRVAKHNTIHDEKRFVALESVDEAHQLQVAALAGCFDEKRGESDIFGFLGIVLSLPDLDSALGSQLAELLRNRGLTRGKPVPVKLSICSLASTTFLSSPRNGSTCRVFCRNSACNCCISWRRDSPDPTKGENRIMTASRSTPSIAIIAIFSFRRVSLKSAIYFLFSAVVRLSGGISSKAEGT